MVVPCDQRLSCWNCADAKEGGDFAPGFSRRPTQIPTAGSRDLHGLPDSEWSRTGPDPNWSSGTFQSPVRLMSMLIRKFGHAAARDWRVTRSPMESSRVTWWLGTRTDFGPA